MKHFTVYLPEQDAIRFNADRQINMGLFSVSDTAHVVFVVKDKPDSERVVAEFWNYLGWVEEGARSQN
jgi:hypothetical protein